MNKELLRDAIAVMETWWAKSPQDMSAIDRAVVTRMRAEIDAPEQEPVAYMLLPGCDGDELSDDFQVEIITKEAEKLQEQFVEWSDQDGVTIPLYTKPQPVDDLQIRLDLMTAERDKLHRENGDMRQSLHFFKPVADLTDDEIRVVYKNLWPGGPHMLKEDFQFVRAVLAAQKVKR